MRTLISQEPDVQTRCNETNLEPFYVKGSSRVLGLVIVAGVGPLHCVEICCW